MSALRISVPGQPSRLIEERDPYLKLSRRSRAIIDVVRAYGGNRSRAARHLGIGVAYVQRVLRDARAAGVFVPDGVTRRGIPNTRPVLTGPRCGKAMKRGICGRPLNHPPNCISVVAWTARRVA